MDMMDELHGIGGPGNAGYVASETRVVVESWLVGCWMVALHTYVTKAVERSEKPCY
jgi:hypothetical protein